MKRIPDDIAMYYFAYGSDVDVKELKKKGISPQSSVPGVLKDYELVLNKKSRDGDFGLPNVRKRKGSQVNGVIYKVLTREIKQMDVLIGYPTEYRRELVKVEEDDVRYDCITYVAASTEEGLQPHPKYMDVVKN